MTSARTRRRGELEGWTNPLRDARDKRLPRIAGPSSLVIFGVTGDLSRKKLMPAVYDLANRGLLPPGFSLVGFGRRKWTATDFGQVVLEAVKAGARTPWRQEVWDRLAEGFRFVQGTFDDDEAFDRLNDTITELDRERGTGGNAAFYLSIPPSDFPVVCKQLARSGLSAQDGHQWRRVVIEKPFGHDLTTARDLAETVHQSFQERQIYRIDHYLGKETVQNIFVFRFANAIFEPVWTNRYVDHVQITVAESLGVEHRAAFYEETGVVRDIVQNHLLQVLALVAMEPPAAFEADAVRDEKTKVLRATRPLSFENTVRGQYGRGFVAGEESSAYAEEEGVPPDSNTPTFIAAKMEIDNWRWAGTPFYIRTGKRLPKRVTEVAVQFKRVPHLPFTMGAAEHLEANSLVLRIQPDEGISLRFGAKAPSPTVAISTVNMDFLYGSAFLNDVPEAYETLILDAIRGDRTLFTPQDGVERSWEICDPLLEQWRSGTPQVYASGSWGPEAAFDLITRDGRRWRRP